MIKNGQIMETTDTNRSQYVYIINIILFWDTYK